MVMRVQGKRWSCRNQCGSNCCSEIFLPVNKYHMKTIKEEGYFIVDNNYSDFIWVGYHPSLEIKKLDRTKRMINVLTKDYEFKYHEIIGMHMLFINEPCKHLQKDGKCKIYRKAPEICRKAECPVFTDNPDIFWYAKNGKLKEAREKYEKGELKP